MERVFDETTATSYRRPTDLVAAFARYVGRNLTASHLARKMARRDKRHRRSGRPVVQHDIQKTRFVKNMQRKRPACEATAEGCTPEQMERWAGIS